jgi:hypothetical protein
MILAKKTNPRYLFQKLHLFFSLKITGFRDIIKSFLHSVKKKKSFLRGILAYMTENSKEKKSRFFPI